MKNTTTDQRVTVTRYMIQQLKNTTTDQRVTVTRLQDTTIEKYYNRSTCYSNTATRYNK
jgi:hypothetical protein